jgi:hypothetical protein
MKIEDIRPFIKCDNVCLVQTVTTYFGEEEIINNCDRSILFQYDELEIECVSPGTTLTLTNL